MPLATAEFVTPDKQRAVVPLANVIAITDAAYSNGPTASLWLSSGVCLQVKGTVDEVTKALGW